MKCNFCGKEIEGFKDELSVKEYKISGLCQECQDAVFEGEEEWYTLELNQAYMANNFFWVIVVKFFGTSFC